jgi:hypothetical protein
LLPLPRFRLQECTDYESRDIKNRIELKSDEDCLIWVGAAGIIDPP